MSAVVTCPRCEGSKGGCSVEFIPCGVCRGQGMVEPHVLDWYDRGDTLRDLRQRMGLSLREAALHLGVSVVDVSEAERGIRDPEPFIRAMEGR